MVADPVTVHYVGILVVVLTYGTFMAPRNPHIIAKIGIIGKQIEKQARLDRNHTKELATAGPDIVKYNIPVGGPIRNSAFLATCLPEGETLRVYAAQGVIIKNIRHYKGNRRSKLVGGSSTAGYAVPGSSAPTWAPAHSPDITADLYVSLSGAPVPVA
jgi:hypothetical protein